MWKRIGPVAVASGSIVAGSSAAGWIVAHAEYCQYGGYISVEKCGVYEVATLMVDMITLSADATLPVLTFLAVVAACLLSCSLHECHDTLKFVVAGGAQRNLRFFPVRHATNIGLRTSLAGQKSEMIAHNAKPARARIIASSAALLELFGPEVVVSNSFSDKAEAGRITLGRLRYGRI
jgi:hypothetical protein